MKKIRTLGLVGVLLPLLIIVGLARVAPLASATSVPVVSAISQAYGPLAGGTSVTITGSGFTGATEVDFGLTSASFAVASDTSITATSPGGTSTNDIIVTTPGGSSAGSPADVFTYATLTITADNQTKIYGSALPTLTASYSGFLGGDTPASLSILPTLTTTATSASHVAGNPYAITASGAFDPDYTIDYVPGTLAVTSAPLTLTANNQSKAYGAALPTLTASYTGLVNGDTSASLSALPSLSTTATSASAVAGSPYLISASGAVDPDYLISYVDGSLNVTSAPLTITADDQTKVYGSALPTLTASYTGFVNGDTAASLSTPPTLSTTATAASAVAGSPYAITASGAVDPDYTISYVAGTLSVTAAPLTISVDNQSKVYGAAVPALTATYTGFVNGDTTASLTTLPTLSTTATASSPVAGSPYPITASGAVDPDYSISYVAGSLAVVAVPLTITVDNQTKVYGAALPTLTATYTGFVNGDTPVSLTTLPTLSTTATASSSVAGGPYAITASGAVDPDYTISYVAATLTVIPAPLTVTADNQIKAYGAAVPTLTASYTGFVNGDTPASLATPATLSTTATAASHVAGNPYAVTASGAVDPDYTISYVPGSLTVTPVPLTITADNQTKDFGAALPVLTASYSGFVNGDTSASLTTPPTLTTTATATSSAAGSPYAITASGALDTNYTISYVAGTLTVLAGPPPVVVPVVNGISPQSGPQSGGTAVIISGTGLSGATGVFFGANPASSFSVLSSTTITAIAPPGAPGAVDVSVSAPTGTSTDAAAFTYLATAVPPVAPVAHGYWQVATDGGVFSFGDAKFFGSTGGVTLNKPIVGMASTPDGRGYWMVASDGGVFSFGDAKFFGSTGGVTLNKPIVGIATSHDGKGYWMAGGDGRIFSFGDAAYSGSTGPLNKPVVGLSALATR